MVIGWVKTASNETIRVVVGSSHFTFDSASTSYHDLRSTWDPILYLHHATMAPGISYDDSGSLASYFGVTFLALILVPGTYVALKPSKKGTSELKESSSCLASLKPLCPCGQCQNRPNELAKRKDGNYGLKAALILGWALFAYLCYKISQAPKLGQTVYNPFEILGLSDSSTEKAIKKHYKKLSLQLYVGERLPKLTL